MEEDIDMDWHWSLVGGVTIQDVRLKPVILATFDISSPAGCKSEHMSITLL